MSEEIRFTTADIDAFAAAAHDHNPLHCLEDYARRTPFGGRVVHGMLGVLAALRPALATLPLPLRSIEIRFHRPLRTAVPHRVSVRSDGPGQLLLELHRGGPPYLTVQLEHGSAPGPFASAPVQPGHAPARAAVAHDDAALVGRTSQGRWCPDGSALAALVERLALRSEHLPPLQLGALLWLSYLVGMELPGRQALFRSARIDFAAGPLPPSHTLDYAARVRAVDAESGRIETVTTLSCAGSDFAAVSVSAYNRPAFGLPDLSAFVRGLAPSGQLRGRVALVTGASGGLGSCIAAGLAAHGADVIVHGRAAARAEQVASTVRELGARALVFAADLDEPGVWERLVKEVRRELKRLDIAVHNASAPPVALGLLESIPEEAEQLVLSPIRTLIRGHQALLPLLVRQRGWVVGISSEAVQTPPAAWWSYVTVKSAGEALLRALAVDHPELRFLQVRPPRLQTEMTAVHRVAPGLPPERIARRIVASLTGAPPPGNFMLLDRFEET